MTAEEQRTLPDFCVFCFATKDLTVDHLTPIVRGGRHVIENLTTACVSCNSSKRDKTVVEWFEASEAAMEAVYESSP